MLGFIRSFLGTVVVVSLLVTNAAAFHDSLAGSSAAKRRMTNAERLARGLPLNPPAVRYTPGVLRARDGASATTTSSSSSTTSSSSSTTPTPTPPVTCPMTGYIGYTNNGNDGYVSVNSETIYLGFAPDTASAAVVTFDTCATGLVNMLCLNCDPSYIGVLTEADSSDNFTPTSGLTGYLALLPLEPPGVPSYDPLNPKFPDPCETTVWSYDNTTSALILNWENDNESMVTLGVTFEQNSLVTPFEISYSATPTAFFYFVPQL